MIHPTAIVDASARIAPDAEIGPWTYIGPDVDIGSGTRVASHVVIKGPTQIGANNQILQFSTVGDDTPDLKYKGEATRLIIGDNNVIREGVTIHRGTVQDRGETVIGNNNLLMAYAHIGHDCVVGDNCIFVNNASISGHVYVGDWTILSGYALVHQFCHIGPHAFVGPATVILKDIPAYVMAAGNPVKANNINVEGLKRRGFSADAITALRRAFKIIYRQGLNVDEALTELRAMVDDTPEVQPLIDSIAKSSRGILR